MKSVLVNLVLILATTAMTHAELVFESKKIELKADPSSEVLEAEFSFKNTGDADVEITEIDTGCSCLSGTADKRVYKPGESGKIEAVFALGSFTGYQQKGLTVIAGNQRTILKVGVQIPDVITIEPDIAEWFIGDSLESKSFKIIIAQPDLIKILDVTCSRPAEFAHELKTIKEGREYELVLTPKSLEKGMLGTLRITTDCKIAKHKRKMAFFAISRPKPGAVKAAPEAETDAEDVGEGAAVAPGAGAGDPPSESHFSLIVGIGIGGVVLGALIAFIPRVLKRKGS
ncbi:MAG: hypothetical protein ACI9NC_003767 [Verrucomicrobiales bacterium]|jgi:hypothetical protein